MSAYLLKNKNLCYSIEYDTVILQHKIYSVYKALFSILGYKTRFQIPINTILSYSYRKVMLGYEVKLYVYKYQSIKSTSNLADSISTLSKIYLSKNDFKSIEPDLKYNINLWIIGENIAIGNTPPHKIQQFYKNYLPISQH